MKSISDNSNGYNTKNFDNVSDMSHENKLAPCKTKSKYLITCLNMIV